MMGFSAKQLQALRRDLQEENIRTRSSHGRELSYIEGWHAIAEANRIFGFDGWDRETVEARCVLGRDIRGSFTAVYVCKVRISVRAQGQMVVREGQGTGESQGGSPGEAHDLALKSAETDATKRALATFGKPFGLALYLSPRPQQASDGRHLSKRRMRAASLLLARYPLTSASALVPAGARTDGGREQRGGIDKAALPLSVPRRIRDKLHLQFVAAQPCLLCGRLPSDPHHLRFAQPRAMGKKVSDEFTVPLCRGHHRAAHQSGNEVAWWNDLDLDPIVIAQELWQQSRSQAVNNNAKAANDNTANDDNDNRAGLVAAETSEPDEKMPSKGPMA